MFENYKHNETREVRRNLPEAVIVTFKKMPKCFKTDSFIELVREITRKDLKEQTILNCLRNQRNNGLVKYMVFDSSRREYMKLK
jgi:hypothetical protein